MNRLLLWIAVLFLVVFPVYYFVMNWTDYTFRSGAIGNWFGTVVGVVVGIPVGLSLARNQQESQLKAERRGEDDKRNELLRSLRHRVYRELEYNLVLVQHVTEVLKKSPTARIDLWKWVAEIVAGLESDSYRELNGLLLPEERALYGGNGAWLRERNAASQADSGITARARVPVRLLRRRGDSKLASGRSLAARGYR